MAGVLTWLGAAEVADVAVGADVALRPFPMPRGSGLGFSYCSADAWTSRSLWCDPRLLDPKGFAAASSYERYKRLHLFVTRMLGSFNDMEDPEKWDVCTRTSLDKMAQICRQWAFDRLPNEDEYDDEDSGLEELYDTIEGTTRELMESVCVHDFGITAFRDSGVTGNALSLLTGGLSRFNPMEWGSCSCEQFMSSVYPDDEHPTYILHELCGYSSACGTPGCIFRDHHFGPHSNDGAEWVGE